MNCWYLLCSDYSCQQQDKFIYAKMFFPNLFIFHFLRSFFIVINVDLEIFIKTHALLYFYNETRTSHQRCSIKKLFLKSMQYLQETPVLESLFNKVAGVQVIRPSTLLKRDSNTGIFLWILQNIYEHLFWRTYAIGCFWWNVHYYIISNKKS